MQPQFSLIGLIIAIVMLLPNFLFLVFFPMRGGEDFQPSVPLIFTVLEKIGQAGSLLVLVFFTKSHFSGKEIDIWFALMAVCFLMYYLMWIRYIVGGNEAAYLFRPFLFIPIPMAVFPVCAILFAAIWGHSLPLGAATLIFAVGHLPISWASALKLP